MKLIHVISVFYNFEFDFELIFACWQSVWFQSRKWLVSLARDKREMLKSKRSTFMKIQTSQPHHWDSNRIHVRSPQRTQRMKSQWGSMRMEFTICFILDTRAPWNRPRKRKAYFSGFACVKYVIWLPVINLLSCECFKKILCSYCFVKLELVEGFMCCRFIKQPHCI